MGTVAYLIEARGHEIQDRITCLDTFAWQKGHGQTYTGTILRVNHEQHHPIFGLSGSQFLKQIPGQHWGRDVLTFYKCLASTLRQIKIKCKNNCKTKCMKWCNSLTSSSVVTLVLIYSKLLAILNTTYEKFHKCSIWNLKPLNGIRWSFVYVVLTIANCYHKQVCKNTNDRLSEKKGFSHNFNYSQAMKLWASSVSHVPNSCDLLQHDTWVKKHNTILYNYLIKPVSSQY